MPSAELKLAYSSECESRSAAIIIKVPGILFFKIGKLHAAMRASGVVGVCIIHYCSAPEKPLLVSLRFYGCNLTNDGGFVSIPRATCCNSTCSLSRLSAFSLVSSTGGQSPLRG
jgi:hypothetical protein